MAGFRQFFSSSGNRFSPIIFAVVSSLWFPDIVAEACCNASHETNLQWEAHDYKWLSLGQTDIRNYPSMYRFSCAIGCNCFCAFNLSSCFIPYIISGIRQCSYVVSFISSHLLFNCDWSDLNSSMATYIAFNSGLYLLAAWLCLTYSCCD